MGIVQGLTEFLPISSSGHLILVPYLFGWDDPFIESLAFSVVLHAGTLAALLVYFRDDWLPADPGRSSRPLRDRSFARRPGPPARLAAGPVHGSRRGDRRPPQRHRGVDVPPAGLVAVMLVIGAGILWLADRWGPRTHTIDRLTPRGALGIGVRPGAGADPGRQPLRHLDVRGAVRGPGPCRRRPLQLPDGHADHRDGRRLRDAQDPARRGGRRRAGARCSSAWWPRSSRASSRSRCCCATCGPARSTSSSCTASCWRPSSSSTFLAP